MYIHIYIKVQKLFNVIYFDMQTYVRSLAIYTMTIY